MNKERGRTRKQAWTWTGELTARRGDRVKADVAATVWPHPSLVLSQWR